MPDSAMTPAAEKFLEECAEFRRANEPEGVVSLTIVWGGIDSGPGCARSAGHIAALILLQTVLEDVMEDLRNEGVPLREGMN